MNGVDPELAQRVAELPLRDIHLPEPVGWWPPAPGWWILLVIVCAVAFMALRWRQHRTRERWRRAALAELDALVAAAAEQDGAIDVVARASTLLRRVCMERFPRSDCAALTGSDWLAYLRAAAPGEHFAGATGDWLIDGPYRRSFRIDNSLLLDAVRMWVAALPGRET